MDKLIDWIEEHEVFVDLLKWSAVLFLAWIAGAFRFLRNYTRKAKLKVVSTASSAYLEEPEPGKIRAAFIVHAVVTNRSAKSVVISSFQLGYHSISFWRGMRQKLLRVAFPSRPQKQVGLGLKLMGVFFTDFTTESPELSATMKVATKLESQDESGGYLLFISYTYGNWNPRIKDDRVRVKLKAFLTNGDVLTNRASIPVERSKENIEKLVPGICEHMAHESTWNHDLSIRK